MGRTPAKIEHGVRCCASANIDKCTGCPYAGLHMGIGCKTILFRDVQDYLKEIKISAARIEDMTKQLESAQPKWISVEERLPGDPDDVVGEVVEILIEKGGNILCVVAGFYDHQEKHWVVYDGLYTPDVCDGCYAVVRKWRSLPEPPKEEA